MFYVTVKALIFYCCWPPNCDSNPQPWQQCSHLHLTKCALYINPLGYLMQCNESIQVMNICGEKRLADCNFRLYDPTQSSITACVTRRGLEALEKEVFQNLFKGSGTHFLHEADSWGSVMHFRWKFLITGRWICVASLQPLRSCKDATGLMQVHDSRACVWDGFSPAVKFLANPLITLVMITFM